MSAPTFIRSPQPSDQLQNRINSKVKNKQWFVWNNKTSEETSLYTDIGVLSQNQRPNTTSYDMAKGN